MSKWLSALLILSFTTIFTCDPYLVIIHNNDYDTVSDAVEATVGSDFSLTCLLKGLAAATDIVWGRRTNKLWFKHETDLLKMAKEGSKQIFELQDQKVSYQLNRATKHFKPLKLTDRGSKNGTDSSGVSITCNESQFKCVDDEICIEMPQKCDGKSDCPGHSDEDWEVCGEDPCIGKIRCADEPCIPTTWCCNKDTDRDCFFLSRHSCCPPISNKSPSKEISKDTNYNIANVLVSRNSVFYFIVIIVVVVVVLTMILLIIKKYLLRHGTVDTLDQNGIPMPTIIRDYLDLPPTYAESTRNSPRSSYRSSHRSSHRSSNHSSHHSSRHSSHHNSSEDIASAPVDSNCTLPPSYDEAMANATISVTSNDVVSNDGNSPSTSQCESSEDQIS